ncbi:MAG: hypothetical protein IKY59_06265, partial [Oscillospiraceae bacterium]|nr:hypothetical protein [Oscillospiraceae bacterium]
ATGLKDLYKTKKEMSIHGLPVRNQVRLVKLLPHSIVMNVWMNQQKKPKNNKNLKSPHAHRFNLWAFFRKIYERRAGNGFPRRQAASE